MEAINQVEAKRTHRPENASYVAKVERHARNEISTAEYFFLTASVGNPVDEQCAPVHEKPTVLKRDEKASAIGEAI